MASKDTKLQIIVDAENRTQGAFAAIGANLDAVSKSTQNMRKGMVAVGSAGTVAFGGLALVSKGAIEAAANFEQTQVAFKTMLGSAELAQSTLADLAKFAAATPFELPEIQNAAKQLLAYGFSTKELIPTLKNLGNVAAGLNIPMSDMAYLFGTLRTQGRAFSKDIYQFTNRGIPIVQELAKVLGVAQDKVMGLVEEGKVGFPEVQKAFENMNGAAGQFGGLMEAQSQTLAGQWSNFKDQITLTAVTIGTQLLPYLKPVLEQLIQIAQAVGQFATEHPKLTTAILVGTLAFTGLLAVLIPISLALPGLVLVFGALGAVFAAVTAISAPLLLVIGAISTALVLLAANGYFTKTAWQDVWLGIKIIAAESANAVIDIVEGMINFVIDGVNTAIRAINRVISAAQKIPGVGKGISLLSTIDPVSLGGFDTSTIAASDLAGRSGNAGSTTNIVNMSNSTFLSKDVAAQIGDMIFKQLKLSSQV